jgi:hypothetical protein
MSQDKQSAIEAAAEARYPRLFSDDPHYAHQAASPQTVEYARTEALANVREIVLAYLNALVEDEGAVEACARAMCKSEEVPPDEVAYTWEDGSMLQWETYRNAARAVLRTLATRAQGEKP